jgi:hypothetical protein
MANGNLQGDSPADAVAKEVSLFNPEMPKQRDSILGHLRVAQCAVNVGGMTVPLLLNGDDLPRASEFRQHLAKIGVDRGQCAVQHDKWSARAVDFVVHIEAIDRGVVTSITLE